MCWETFRHTNAVRRSVHQTEKAKHCNESWNMYGTTQFPLGGCHHESQIPIETHQRKGVEPTGFVCIARTCIPNHRPAYRTWKYLVASNLDGQAMEPHIAPVSKLIGLALHPSCKEVESATRIESQAVMATQRNRWALSPLHSMFKRVHQNETSRGPQTLFFWTIWD